MKIFKKISFWSLIAIAVIQFIPIDRVNKPVDAKVDFVNVFNTPPAVRNILIKACYDCHSNETVYPDYAYVAPVSWSIKNHISEGREHLNLSECGNYNEYLKKSMLENTVRSVRQYEMPLPAYITKHPTANLTKEERELLANYFENILKSGDY